MKNFKQRALAWAKANPYATVARNGYRCLARGRVFNLTEEHYTVNNKLLTEVILEWENETSNEMPKLEAGMVVEYAHKGSSKHYISLVVRNDYLVSLDTFDWTGELDDSEIIKIWGISRSSINYLSKQDYAKLKPIWQRESKEKSELKSVIADLEKNLADAKERLKAIK